jgi:NADPH:quinone reductase-like Zn-dependent oxidoreductase
MRAAVVRAFDAPPRYEEDFAEPEVGEGEVLVHVHAAGIHPLVKALANGTHYGSGDGLPFVPGVDGVGNLEDGARVYFGGVRRPFGTMAALAAAPRAMCVPLPEGMDEAVAAAAANPGMSAWLALTWRARLAPGETVLVLGATGVAGQMAVQMAKRLGAGRVIAAGRNPEVLAKLADLGADVTVSVDQAPEELARALAREGGSAGIHVIVDYLWGKPAEAAIAAVTRKGFQHEAPRVRFVQVGASSGATLTLPAAVLRSSGLEITGTGAGTVPWARIFEAVPEVLAQVAAGALRVDVQRMRLTEVASAWQAAGEGRRIVLVP